MCAFNAGIGSYVRGSKGDVQRQLTDARDHLARDGFDARLRGRGCEGFGIWM